MTLKRLELLCSASLWCRRRHANSKSPSTAITACLYRSICWSRTERGSLYSWSECGKACAAHDFADKTWRHLIFFQHFHT
ncbi:hypothetical protein F1978_16930 [Vreelandella piezotolerans]|uniref:Secreted protein n=1 Tax=Vreelandella piezotolerans TaxID=2609667 RepID=A0ABQ6X7I6_9GAMM|nr:hypothetical protein F1978_16930 [Halomonas piezotolerans]